MNYYFDTEFIEDGRTIDLVSIGIINSRGETYYAVSSEFDATKASEWVVENVLSKLGDTPRKSRAVIRAEVLAFCGLAPRFWAYYADYDWVALCQLFGTMMDLPQGWPMYCRDLKQVADEKGVRLLRRDDQDAHNALDDAKWVREQCVILGLDPEVRATAFV